MWKTKWTVTHINSETEPVDSVSVYRALWTYVGLHPIYHFSYHSVNLMWLQLWDQVNHRSLYLLRNWLKGMRYCPFQDQHCSLSSALSGSPCWAVAEVENQRWVSHFLSELSCRFPVFLTFLLLWEDGSAKILVPSTLVPISGPPCVFSLVFSVFQCLPCFWLTGLPNGALGCSLFIHLLILLWSLWAHIVSDYRINNPSWVYCPTSFLQIKLQD